MMSFPLLLQSLPMCNAFQSHTSRVIVTSPGTSPLNSMSTVLQRVVEVAEEQDAALCAAHPCSAAAYYVQSPPSSASCANSSTAERPTNSSPVTLSSYSSRCSNDSFLHQKKVSYGAAGARRNRLVVVGKTGREDVNGEDDGERPWTQLRRFLSLDPSSCCFCIAFQIGWRFMLSLGVALFVFYLSTKPPLPKVSVEITDFQEFKLVEGLDGTGVVTKVLSFNCSMEIEIENQSKVFGLHLHPPIADVSFGRVELASTQGHKAYIKAASTSAVNLHVDSKGRLLYGAGQMMQDILESRRGLPLQVRVRSSSKYEVVRNLIRPTYSHSSTCALVLDGTQDVSKHSLSLTYKSSCQSTIHRS